MKLSSYKKLFKRFWMFFFIPNLYGMECGVVGNHINQCSQIESDGKRAFVGISKDALGIENISSSEEVINIMDELFRAFVVRRNKDEETKTYLGGKNLAFYKGDAYINGLIPTNYGYDNLWLKSGKRKPYHVKQLYEVLGFNKNEAKKLENMTRIRNNFYVLFNSSEKHYVRSFWNKIRGKTYSEINTLLNAELKQYGDWSYEYGENECAEESEKIKAVSDYIKALHGLGIATKDWELSKDLEPRLKTLHKSYCEAAAKTQKVLEKYLEEFGKYITYFDIDDGVEFLTTIYQLSSSKAALDCWIKTFSEPKYKRYTHTEYMIRYMHRNETTPLCIISLNDACKICEQMLAKTTSQESGRYNTIIISAQKYANSRARERLDDNTNFSFLQIQMHPKYFFNLLDTIPSSDIQASDKQVVFDEVKQAKTNGGYSRKNTASTSKNRDNYNFNKSVQTTPVARSSFGKRSRTTFGASEIYYDNTPTKKRRTEYSEEWRS